jgi:hypothetical protein
MPTLALQTKPFALQMFSDSREEMLDGVREVTQHELLNAFALVHHKLELNVDAQHLSMWQKKTMDCSQI